MSVESDIRRAVVDLLAATGKFDAVREGAIERPRDLGASAWRAATVEPDTSQLADDSDAAPDGDTTVDCRIHLTLIARHEDPEARDRAAEAMLGAARNAVAGRSLADQTFVQFTKVQSWRWLPAEDNERRIAATIRTIYEEPGWAAADDDE